MHSPYEPISSAIPYTCHRCLTSVPTQNPCSFSVDHSSSKAQNPQRALERAFRSNSAFPNEACAKLLEFISQSTFIGSNQLEPSIDSDEGQRLLKNIRDMSDCPPMAFQKSNLSIFALLVDINSRRCLICNSAKSSLDRAIGCVRSHLNHRPFVCGGEPAGCVRCKDYARSDMFESHTVNIPLTLLYPGPDVSSLRRM
jgi:hypothetical protein